MPAAQTANERQSLRRELKHKRLETSRAFRRRAAKAVASNLWKSRLLTRKRNVAIYLATAGEVDCQEIIAGLRMRNLRIFAPVIASRRLIFAPIGATTKLRKNRYLIDEPNVARKLTRPPQQLDAVIVPLLGFDANGNRLGMGGGYYDRSFAFRKQRQAWRHPLLIGVAYSFQRVDAIQTETWDIPVDVVITEQEFRKKL